MKKGKNKVKMPDMGLFEGLRGKFYAACNAAQKFVQNAVKRK